MARPGWVSGAWRPIVLHNFAYAMHKKTGAPLPTPTYPRLDRAKPEFQHRGPRRRCRKSWTPRDWRRFGARRDAKRALSPRRTPSANPNRLPKDPAGSKRRFRRVCSHPGLLKTPEMHGAPRGTRARHEKHARIQKNASAKAGCRQGRQAAGEIPGRDPARAPHAPRVSRKPHALRRCRPPHTRISN